MLYNNTNKLIIENRVLSLQLSSLGKRCDAFDIAQGHYWQISWIDVYLAWAPKLIESKLINFDSISVQGTIQR